VPLMNRIQEAFAKTGMACAGGLDLPQIAVVGAQSAGKSSVLEAFVGREFLPRGTNMVTRRPLIIQLVTNHRDPFEYGEFLHLPRHTRFTDFADIRTEIEEETERVVGTDGSVSDLPIHLKIVSPHVLSDLTLVDLPGMTKVAVGNQPKDIEAQIRTLITDFIRKESCLILAVTAGNTDLATSDALNLAKSVDPEGKRTIGVLTKLDLMDEGTDAREILENRLLPLKRGWVGVANRAGGRGSSNRVSSEAEFFSGHPAYKHMTERLGSPYLQKVLSAQLSQHIREALPSLKARIERLLLSVEKDVEKDAKRYGAQPINLTTSNDIYSSPHLVNAKDPATCTKLMLQALQELQQEIEKAIDGHHRGYDAAAAAVTTNASDNGNGVSTNSNNNINTYELSGGVKINRIFHERFPYDLLLSCCVATNGGDEATAAAKEESKFRQEIGMVIANSFAVRCSGTFSSNSALETVIKKQIEKLRDPCLRCLDLVVQELSHVVITSINTALHKFPKLKDLVEYILQEHIAMVESQCKERLGFIVDCELAYINTKHEDLMAGGGSGGKGQRSSSTSKVSNEVIRRGWMSIVHGGAATAVTGAVVGSSSNFVTENFPQLRHGHRFWFVLQNHSLSWYKDETERDKKFMTPLDDLRIRNLEQTAGGGGVGFSLGRRSHSTVSPSSFALFNATGKSVYKDWKSLELVCENQESAEFWKASFLRVGVFPQNGNNGDNSSSIGLTGYSGAMFQPHVERQVESIRSVTRSYLKIVTKTCRDIVPKTIMLLVIKNIKTFVYGELTAQVYSLASPDLVGLMQESPEEVKRREEALKQYAACKEALNILNQVSSQLIQLPRNFNNNNMGGGSGGKDYYSFLPAPPSSSAERKTSLPPQLLMSSMPHSQTSPQLYGSTNSIAASPPKGARGSGGSYLYPAPVTKHSSLGYPKSAPPKRPPPIPPPVAARKASSFTSTPPPPTSTAYGSHQSLI